MNAINKIVIHSNCGLMGTSDFPNGGKWIIYRLCWTKMQLNGMRIFWTPLGTNKQMIGIHILFRDQRSFEALTLKWTQAKIKQNRSIWSRSGALGLTENVNVVCTHILRLLRFHFMNRQHVFSFEIHQRFVFPEYNLLCGCRGSYTFKWMTRISSATHTTHAPEFVIQQFEISWEHRLLTAVRWAQHSTEPSNNLREH